MVARWKSCGRFKVSSLPLLSRVRIATEIIPDTSGPDCVIGRRQKPGDRLVALKFDRAKPPGIVMPVKNLRRHDSHSLRCRRRRSEAPFPALAFRPERRTLFY